MAMMRSATLVAPYDIRIEEVERPEVKDDYSVIVKVEGLGICGSNLHHWYGGGAATGLLAYPMPGAGCHEFAGVVAEVGKRVTRVKPGDRITLDQYESRSCGRCPYCQLGLFTQCENLEPLGLEGFVEYLSMREKGLYKLPENIETHCGAVVEPYACSVSAVRRAGVKGGEKVVVLGAGVLGVCAAGAAKALGASQVVITAKYETQRALAKKFGADVIVNSGSERVVDEILAALGGRGADVVVETVGGHAPTLTQAMHVVRKAGKVAVLGLWDELVPVDSWQSVLKDITYLFCLTHGIIDGKADYDLCLEWMVSRQVPAQDLVTHVLPLERIADAFRLAADKKSGAVKVIVKP